MKILLVANTDWYLYRFRLGLAHFLTQQGHIVTLVSPPGNYAEAIQAQGVRWLAWTVGRQTVNPFTELRSFLQLA
ncbi:MAG: glycosyltransferase, partial [Anaerolineales bacterium]